MTRAKQSQPLCAIVPCRKRSSALESTASVRVLPSASSASFVSGKALLAASAVTQWAAAASGSPVSPIASNVPMKASRHASQYVLNGGLASGSVMFVRVLRNCTSRVLHSAQNV